MTVSEHNTHTQYQSLETADTQNADIHLGIKSILYTEALQNDYQMIIYILNYLELHYLKLESAVSVFKFSKDSN